MEEDTPYYRRNLPHYQPLEATFFVTFRLTGSLPYQIIKELKAEQETAEQLLRKDPDNVVRKKKLSDLRKKYFGKFDTRLDFEKTGPLWLGIPAIAELVSQAMHYRDGKQYDLIAYTIMPNHVHLVFSLLPDVGRLAESSPGRDGVSPYIVTNIIGSIKKHTALNANEILNRRGAFWQHESYDHVVRDGKELERVIYYVLNNPVSASLAKSWESWKWSYVKYGYL
jgi:REP element-mobilizing transposase RayT